LPTPAISPDFTHLSDESTPVRLRSSFNLLAPCDLAALIGIDERTLAVWRVQRRGPDFVKLGRAVFYRHADIEAWIELNKTPTDRAA
jgi:predicted DNA-binding transcriptional regulator AlpA